MIDAARLRHTVDAVAYIGQHLQLHRHGREYAGPCPFCPCTASLPRHRCDRFRIFEDGRWWCRRCESCGDVIDFVMKVEGLDFRAACARLGAPDTGRMPASRHPPAGPEQPRPFARITPPTPEWRRGALEVVEASEAALWGEDGARARDYLHDARLLSDETVRAARLGYSPRRQTIAGHVVQQGIVIPRFVGGEVVHINVRRRTAEPKYMAIAGGVAAAPYGLDDLRGLPVLAFAEGEFDSLLLRQQCGDLLDVVTLGGAAIVDIPAELVPGVLFAERVLALLDADAAGERAAQELAARYGAVVVLPPEGLDLTDLAQRGGSLRQLVEPYIPARADRSAAVAVDSEDLDNRVCARCGEPTYHRTEPCLPCVAAEAVGALPRRSGVETPSNRVEECEAVRAVAEKPKGVT